MMKSNPVGDNKQIKNIILPEGLKVIPEGYYDITAIPEYFRNFCVVLCLRTGAPPVVVERLLWWVLPWS